jgi:hypothetical protein
VLLWDARCGPRPRSVITAPRAAGSLFSVQVAADDAASSSPPQAPELRCLHQPAQAVYAGSETGDVYCWDLRGGRLQAAAFAGSSQVSIMRFPLLPTQPTRPQVVYPLLHTLNIRSLLQDVPELLQQVDFETSAVCTCTSGSAAA